MVRLGGTPIREPRDSATLLVAAEVRFQSPGFPDDFLELEGTGVRLVVLPPRHEADRRSCGLLRRARKWPGVPQHTGPWRRRGVGVVSRSELSIGRQSVDCDFHRMSVLAAGRAGHAVQRVAGWVEAAAVGVPSAKSGEAVKVFVVRSDPSLDAETLIAYTRERLTGYKTPDQVEFVDELPKSNVGKVLRRELKSSGKAD